MNPNKPFKFTYLERRYGLSYEIVPSSYKYLYHSYILKDLLIILIKNNIPLEIIYIIYIIAQIRYDYEFKLYFDQLYSKKNVTFERSNQIDCTSLRIGKHIRLPTNYLNLMLNDINLFRLSYIDDDVIYDIKSIIENNKIIHKKLKAFKDFIFKWYEFISYFDTFNNLHSIHLRNIFNMINKYFDFYYNIFVDFRTVNLEKMIKEYTSKEIIECLLNLCYSEYFTRIRYKNIPGYINNQEHEFDLFVNDHKQWKKKYQGIKLIFNNTVNYIPECILIDRTCSNIFNINTLMMAGIKINIEINKPKIYDTIKDCNVHKVKPWPSQQYLKNNETYPVDSWGPADSWGTRLN